MRRLRRNIEELHVENEQYRFAYAMVEQYMSQLRRCFVVVSSLGAFVGLALSGTAVYANEPMGWERVIDGKLASVSVAKALFEQKDGKYFHAGIRVTNKFDRAIGVDLRSRRYCVRINQWSAIDTAERGIIDEQREGRPEFTADDQASLREAFRAGKFVQIPARKSVDYYCPFIGEERDSNRAAVEKLPTKFVILSMDGELRVTNGEQSESLRCGEPGEADVSIPRPVPWHEVPSGAHIVSEDFAEKAEESPPDSAAVESIFLFPAKPSSGWMIRFYPDGSVNAQFGSALGQAVLLPKGSVHFGALLKAAYRLKSDRRTERTSTIAVSFKDEPNVVFSLIDDTLFRYVIDSFDEKWKPDIGISRVDTFLRERPIFMDEKPAISAGR